MIIEKKKKKIGFVDQLEKYTKCWYIRGTSLEVSFMDYNKM